MDIRYNNAMTDLEDTVAAVCIRANLAGITNDELAEELHRMAMDLETSKRLRGRL